MIYFAQAVSGGPVKIGTSTDVDARLAQLEAHYGQPLALLATLPGGRAEEREWHERFRHLRLGRTEQFQPAAELMGAIGRPLLVAANANTVEAMDTPGKVIGPRSVQTGIRSTPEWREWVAEFAGHVRKDVADTFDEAMARYARSEGFRQPPKR